LNKHTIRKIFIIISLAILSLSLSLAIRPAIEGTLKERFSLRSDSDLRESVGYQVSAPNSELIPISNSMTSNNNTCSIGWQIEGYFMPSESDYDGKGYAQTITIHNLNDTNNVVTRTLNSEFLENVQMQGWWGLTKQGDYIGGWDDQFWGPVSSISHVLQYPLVAGLTSETDTIIIPYSQIFTVPTLPPPWNTKTFMALEQESNVTGKQVKIYTGFGSGGEKEKEKITGIENILCMHKQTSAEECETSTLPNSTQAGCNPNSTITATNISIGDPVYDQFDSYIVSATNHYGITDLMMIKSLIMQESYFDMFAVSSDIPCGVPDGWTDQESKSFGLMQLTPACIAAGGSKPNLTTDNNTSNWATSWFNPEYNIDQGVKSLADTLSLMKNKFSGCTDDQYMLMALGAYNSGQGAIYGCSSWNARANLYITNVTENYRILSQIANILSSS
jgi:Transglycosylase SLT domain